MRVVKTQAALLLIIQRPCGSITLPAQSCQVRQAAWDDLGAPWKHFSALPALMREARLKVLGGRPGSVPARRRPHPSKAVVRGRGDGGSRGDSLGERPLDGLNGRHRQGRSSLAAEWPWTGLFLSLSLFSSLENPGHPLLKVVLQQ